MDKEQLLAQLRDVHMPTELSWWPLAIGWWVLIALLVAVIAFIFYKYLKKIQAYKNSQFALKELESLKVAADDNWLIQLQVLLRRVSLCYFNKQQVASLQQEEWIDFLSQTGQSIWSPQTLQTLRDAPYQKSNQLEPQLKSMLFSQSKAWIKAIPKVRHV